MLVLNVVLVRSLLLWVVWVRVMVRMMRSVH